LPFSSKVVPFYYAEYMCGYLRENGVSGFIIALLNVNGFFLQFIYLLYLVRTHLDAEKLQPLDDIFRPDSLFSDEVENSFPTGWRKLIVCRPAVLQIAAIYQRIVQITDIFAGNIHRAGQKFLAVFPLTTIAMSIIISLGSIFSSFKKCQQTIE
jgi:hypothetical protein